jgi:hypothetical protein
MALLVTALRHYAQAPSINQARAAERHKILAEARQKDHVELETAAFIDKEKGIVRLPNRIATALSLQLAQNPAQARSNLIERAAKAFFVPPPPPEPKSEFE